MHHCADLIKRHITRSINSPREHECIAYRSAAFDNAAAIKAEVHRLASGCINQATWPCNNAQRISRRASAIGAIVGREQTSKACCRIGRKHRLVNRKRWNGANGRDHWRIIIHIDGQCAARGVAIDISYSIVQRKGRVILIAPRSMQNRSILYDGISTIGSV